MRNPHRWHFLWVQICSIQNNSLTLQAKFIHNLTNEIVLYQPDATIQLEVRLQDETVWLNQQQMADLFGTQRQAITKHLKNIFECGELDRQATCSILELVQKEGNRMVRRHVVHFENVKNVQNVQSV